MKLSEMTKDERSLLLYFETAAVDQRGLVDQRRLNDADRKIAERWAKSGFVEYGRVAFSYIVKNANGIFTSWVKLSEEAWRLAHEERRARAGRMWDKRTWKSTAEVRNQSN